MAQVSARPSAFRKRVLPTRTEMLAMSSETYSARIKQIAEQGYCFTRSEEQEIKRCKHLIVNREYACISRKRQKDHVVQLQSRVDELEAECLRLHIEIARLQQPTVPNDPVIKIDETPPFEWQFVLFDPYEGLGSDTDSF